MQRDDPATEQPIADVLEAGTLEQRGEVVGAGEAAHARREVRVRLPAGQHPPEHGHDAVEPEPEERPEEAARPRDLEHGHLPAGSEDAGQLAQTALQVGEVADAEPDGRRVELAVAERQRERVALHPLDRAGLLPRPFEHLLREVEPDDASPAPLGLDGEVTGAAARVEHAIPRPHDLRDRQLAPAPVEPGRHHAVHHVVDGSDAVEHPAHGVRGERARLVGHALWPQRGMSALSIPIWSRHRATTKSTRSSIVSAPW